MQSFHLSPGSKHHVSDQLLSLEKQDGTSFPSNSPNCVPSLSSIILSSQPHLQHQLTAFQQHLPQTRISPTVRLLQIPWYRCPNVALYLLPRLPQTHPLLLFIRRKCRTRLRNSSHLLEPSCNNCGANVYVGVDD